MIVSVVFLVVFSALVHFINCSTIITRGMIRTPVQSSSQSKVPQIVLPDPEKLISTNGDVHKKYQRIYPSFVGEERRTNFKRVLEDGHKEVLKNNSGSEPIHAIGNTNLNQTKTPNRNKSETNMESNFDNIDDNSKNISENTSGDGTPVIDQFESSSTISPQEISKRYWERYSNLSSEFFKDSYQQNFKDVTVEKGFSDASIWEILQRFYTCTWAIGLLPCLQETYRVVSSETSFLQFLSPRLPRFELEGSPVQEYFNNEDTDQQATDQDEGRKRTKRLQVFQALQFLIPLLLAIKMSMLPALAIMVLVTGKAFFMSLLSLGAAIFSFFLQTPGLVANKRQEISPHMSAPHNQDPSKYYYVM